jgi:hypothetical protein
MTSRDYKDITEEMPGQKLPNDTDTDFKPEVIAASLIEQGYNPEQIQIIREGYARRGFAKEVEAIELKYSLHNRMDTLHIKINREGMYDTLPQGLFHQPLFRGKINKDKEDILQEMAYHRREEFFARKFFHVFELIEDEMVTEAFLSNIKLHKKISHPDFVNLFLPYWPMLKRLAPERANLFLYIIPILHQIRDRREETEKSISVILDVPVKIENIVLPAKIAERSFSSTLGVSRMDDNFVLGHSFDDGESDLKVTIGPISSNRMIDFIAGGKDDELLEILFDLFLPVSAFAVKEFKILPEDAVFVLSGENAVTFLGINSFI